MRWRCCWAPSGLVRKSATLSRVDTHFRSRLCFRTKSLTKKKFCSMLLRLLLGPLSSATSIAAQLSHKIVHLAFGNIERIIWSKNCVNSTAPPNAMYSEPHVDLAVDFWRLDPHAIGQLKHLMMNPEVDRWYSPPQLASDQVVKCESSGFSLNFLSFVVWMYPIRWWSAFQCAWFGLELNRARKLTAWDISGLVPRAR
jgi:hypothetical protein